MGSGVLMSPGVPMQTGGIRPTGGGMGSGVPMSPGVPMRTGVIRPTRLPNSSAGVGSPETIFFSGFLSDTIIVIGLIWLFIYH